MKKLYRSHTSHVISGVCAGIGEYAGVDFAVVRLLYLFITLVTGFFPGIVVYLAAAIFVPVKPHA